MSNKYLARRTLKDFAGYVDPDFRPNYELPHAQFVMGVLQRAVDGELWDGVAGEGPRILILTMPPGHYKSSMLQKACAYFIGRKMTDKLPHNVAYSSYNGDLAEEASRIVRDTVMEPRFANVFPSARVNPQASAVSKWGLVGESRTSFRAVGVGGGLTGFRAHLLAIDDPIKDAEEANSEAKRESIWDWWKTVARTRLTNDSIVILVMTPWHDEDLRGKLLKEEAENPGSYRIKLVRIPALAETDAQRREIADVMDVPVSAETASADPLGRVAGEALCPEIMTRGMLEALRGSDKQGFACLYQGSPRPEGGFLLGRGAFKHLVALPDEGSIRWVIGTDWAITEKEVSPKRGNDPDYTAAALFGVWTPDLLDPDTVAYVLAAVVRGQYEEGDAQRMVMAFAERCERLIGARVPIAAGQDNIDKVILSRMRKHPKMMRWEITNIPRAKMKGDKVVRSAGWRSRANNKKFYVIDESWYGEPWQDVFFTEVEGFPRAKHDDMIDAVSVGEHYLAEMAYGVEHLPMSLFDLDASGLRAFLARRAQG